MKARDKNIKQHVSVADSRCLKCSCYWPRPDPGLFTQGQGYRRREGKQEWLCGTREIKGCPTRATCCNRAYAAYETKCRECGHSLENEMEIDAPNARAAVMMAQRINWKSRAEVSQPEERYCESAPSAGRVWFGRVRLQYPNGRISVCRPSCGSGVIEIFGTRDRWLERLREDYSLRAKVVYMAAREINLQQQSGYAKSAVVTRYPTKPTRQMTFEPLPASDLFVLGRPLADLDLLWFRHTAEHGGCLHHAARGDGKTFCGRSTRFANYEGRTMADDDGWPSCHQCAASLRKHGVCAPWERTNGELTDAGSVTPASRETQSRHSVQ